MADTSRIAYLACGKKHIVALTVDGLIYTWGASTNGVLGRKVEGSAFSASNAKYDFKPSLVVPCHIDNVPVPCIQIACGNEHSLALTSNGEVYAWGKAKSGQAGCDPGNLDHDGSAHIPELLEINEDVQRISASGRSSCCLTMSNRVLVWGEVSCMYQLPNASMPNELLPRINLLSGPGITSRSSDHMLAGDHIAISRSNVYMTLRKQNIITEFDDRSQTMKKRQNRLNGKLRGARKHLAWLSTSAARAGDASMGGDKGIAQTLNIVRNEMRAQKLRIRRRVADAQRLHSELSQVIREATLSDQQMTMMDQRADEYQLQQQSESNTVTTQRQIEIQIRDLHNFQDTNKKLRLQLFERQAQLENQLLESESKIASARTHLKDLLIRESVLKGFSMVNKRSSSNANNISFQKAVPVAVNTIQDIQHSGVFSLAQNGNFTGTAEVLLTSSRSLSDLSSSLKEIFSDCGAVSDETVLMEQMLETKIKFQKMINRMCMDKFERNTKIDDTQDTLPEYFSELSVGA